MKPTEEGTGEQRLLTVREAAARLGVCRATVYKLCERGRLAHVRLLSSLRIPERALEAFIETGGSGDERRRGDRGR